MQKTFDSLYADSKSGEVFGHLMDIISAPSNIKLAFRNIKGNDGSHTAGTDGRTIESLAVMPEDKFVKLIQKQFRRYEPKAVKRVEIPKPNGKMRPLGIPCIIDRIVPRFGVPLSSASHFTTYFCTQKNRRTGFPIRRQAVYLPNKSLCVPVRASVSTRTSSSMR